MRARALLCVPVVVLLAGEAAAQSRIEGVVRGVDGSPLAQATVDLEAGDRSAARTATTAADGSFVIEDVKPGTRVRLTVSHGGRLVAEAYVLVTQWVEKINIQEPAVPSRPASARDVLATRGAFSGEIGGVIRLGDSLSSPVARVTIDQTGLAASVDSAGRYVFRGLRPGVRVTLQASAAGYRPETREATVPNGDRLEVDFALDPAPVAWSAGEEGGSGPEGAAETGRFAVRPEQAAPIPGLAVRDLLRTMQLLPGVGGSLEATADPSVRGGAPGETLVTYDAYTVYPADHVFSTLSAYNTDTASKVELSRSSASARDGGRLSGALRMTGQSNDAGRATGWVDLSVFGVGGVVSVPLASHGSFLVAARRTPPADLYKDALDQFVGGGGFPARDRAARLADGTLRAAPVSLFQDLNARLDLKIGAKDRIAVSGYDGRDDTNLSRDLPFEGITDRIDIPTPFEPPTDSVVEVSDLRAWRARGFGATWSRRWAAGRSTTVSVGHSRLFQDRNGSDVFTSPSTGEDYSFAANRGGHNGLTEVNEIRDTTVRVDSAFDVGFAHALRFGGEVSAYDTTYALQGEVFDQKGGPRASVSTLTDLLQQKASGRLVTVFAEDSWRPFTRLAFSPAVRVVRYDLAEATHVEPRIHVGYEVTPAFRLRGGWAIDHQAVNRVTREDRARGDRTFWALSDGSTIPVARARQVVAGGSVEVRGLLVDFEVYHRSLDDLALLAPRLFPGVAPEAGATLFHQGSGTARGMDALLLHKVSRNTFWASYSLSQVEYSYPTLEAAVFPASHDQTHEFKVADALRVGAGWWVSGTFVAGSGRPYTPGEGVEPVWFPSGASVNEITFGAKNSARLPAYHRVDVSTRYDLRLGALRTTVGVAVLNAYDRKNAWFYDYQAAGDLLSTADITQLGRVVNVFVRVGF